MPSQLTIYEEMKALSTRMVEAAQARDWDNLILLETSIRRLRDSLVANPDVGVISVAEIERKRGLIQQILNDDAEIRLHTEPWMEHVRQFLGSHSLRREVNKAYAAGAGEAAVG